MDFGRSGENQLYRDPLELDFNRTFRKPKIAELKGDWPPFNPDQSYAVISEKPRIEKKFRFCQVALWGGLMDVLQNPTCNLPGIKDVVNILPKELAGASILNPKDAARVFEDVKDKLRLPTPHIKLPTDVLKEKPLPVPDILTGGDRKSSQSPLVPGLLKDGNKSGENKSPGGLLSEGGLLGRITEKAQPKSSSSTTKKPSLGLDNIFG